MVVSRGVMESHPIKENPSGRGGGRTQGGSLASGRTRERLDSWSRDPGGQWACLRDTRVSSRRCKAWGEKGVESEHPQRALYLTSFHTAVAGGERPISRNSEGRVRE